MPRRIFHSISSSLLLGLLSFHAIAQVGGSYGHPEESRVVTLASSPNTGIITFKVFAERNGSRLNRQAVVKLVNLADQTATWRPTGDNAEGVFTDIPYGEYGAEISAVGYLSSYQGLKVTGTHNVLEFDILLHRDPAAVNFDVDDGGLSPKARKEAKRAISALKSGRLDEAQRHLDESYRASPSDANLNFLLGYLYFQKKDYARASSYLTASTRVNRNNLQALTLLGRSSLEQRNYPAAQSALEQAVMADEDNWLPHNLLADAYLHEKNYDKARIEAQVAITKGKTAATPAQLVLGEALLNLGQEKEGVEALEAFLEESPRHPVAGQVRSVIAEVEEHASEAKDEAPATEGQLAAVDPLSALPDPSLSVKAWRPPGIDDLKLAVAPGVICPSGQVIGESGERVQELVDDLARFAAIEDLVHQTLDAYGNPVRTETRKFDYVASISEVEPGYLAVAEDRAAKLSLSDYPGNIASTGFATLALVFHPHMRDNFDLVCEGLGDWHGKASWLVRFQQRSDRPNRMHSYKVGDQFHPVPLKGRAWISTDKFQIMRIEAEMVKPMPEIQLLSEHQVVEYGPVPFPKRNTTLWLPKSAEIYFDFRKHRYYRRHSFDHYMLFSVDSEEKPKTPLKTARDGSEKGHT
ncbi:MAG TPA: tetratricopeptide repeat protein [Candidatus Sulfotelmatobacter sp.]|nr:tetratricopeptide repeat protein [Candidatus Sulfotelmatobacter sp.]